ncbi:glycosyltransferase [Pedobacter sp. SD-b]|uniref:Glycosyltransferase n=1 Tax=Pedobacter segetis TaxID=2793069 RepID=A0ABS1BFK6_9SPHI|nr:glycosyltransferase [Pedobacter segetis]MBK0381652.1 glycosyltransferase [Pedobacter segetis]
MKVCHISFSFLIGGIENMLVDILEEQSKHIDTTLIVINDHYDKKILNRISNKVKIILINRPEGSKNPYYLSKLWLTLYRINPSVIHCHTPNIIDILFPFKSRCIYTAHTTGVATENLHNYKKLFSISKAVEHDLMDRGGLTSEMIYNGIDFTLFKTKKNYKVKPDEQFKLVQISRLLHEQKGQDILLEAMFTIVHKLGIKNIHLDIIGDGPSESYLKNLCEELKLQDQVSFLGPKDRSWIYESLINYHALVQPSRFEGFGITVIEAIATGIPVISSNIEGPLEVLQNVDSAYIFDINNVNDLVSDIRQVVSDYQDNEIEKKCLQGLKVTEGKFKVKDTAINYLKAYKQLI